MGGAKVRLLRIMFSLDSHHCSFLAGEEDPELVLDMVTGEELASELAVVAYIYKQRWPRDLLISP